MTTTDRRALGGTRRPDDRIDLVEAVALTAVATVAWTATVALVLANLDRFTTAGVLVVGAALPVAVGVWGWRHRRQLGVSPGALAVVALAGVVGAVTLLPGFPYLVGDKDPGVYAAHAVAIERTGGTAVEDPVLSRRDEVPVTPYLVHRVPAMYPGYWVDQDDPARVRPQFFHLLPSLLAVAYGVGGFTLLFNVIPAITALAAATLGLAVRRVAGTAAGALTSVLLLVNLMQVWHGRHPATEILTEAFLAGAGLALVLARDARRGWLATVAGILVATGFLARPDGLLPVLIAYSAAMLLVGLRREVALAGRFLAGLGVGMAYASYQAWHLNRTYLLANDMPDWPLVLAGAAAVAVGAVGLRVATDRWGERLAPAARRLARGRDPRTLLATAVGAAAAVGLVLAWFRPDLFDPVIATTLDGRRIPRLDEYNLRKLSWFFTVPGLVVMWAGLVLAMRRRSLTPLWLVVLPGAALFPLYVWEAHIESRLLWWSRRFVPAIIPAMAILIAVALAALLAHEGRRRTAARTGGAVLAALLVVLPARQTLEVRPHREFGGSVELIEQIASVAPTDALFLWEHPAPGDPFDPSRVLAGPVWFVHGHASALLPESPTPDDVAAFVDAFADRPVYAVTRTDEVLEALAAHDPAPVLEVDTALAHWQEADFEVPLDDLAIPFTVTVWELHR